MKTTSFLAKWGVAVLLLSSLSSCEDILEQYFPKPTPTPPTIPTFPPLGQDIAFYALSGGNRLDGYNTSNAATRTSSVAITGLGSGETLLAIDFRPATGQLYGVSSASRIYVINQNTGAARAIGAGAFSPAVAGNLVGFDFNPTVDRIRLVTSTGQNLRLNPETGTVAATDGVLNGAAGATITGAAYMNNTNGASTTILYDLDPASDQLYRQDPPNAGTLVAVGNLNLNITGNGGFDIDATTGTALGLYAVNGNPTLFAVNLTTGAAQPLAQYATSSGYSGLAIPTQPIAYSSNAGFSRTPDDKRNDLLWFNPTSSASTNSTMIRGLAGNETVVGLDFRPATGQLYALVVGWGITLPPTTRLYTINPATGEATRVADVGIPLGDAVLVSFDFNPVADRIRIVTFEGRNFRVNPTDGSFIEDTRLNPAIPIARAVAYDNSFAGATATTLYVISGEQQSRNNRLYIQNPPNAGTLTEVGNMGQPGIADFDIGGTTNTAYALGGGAPFRIYSINLATGETTSLRTFFAASATFTFAVGLGF